MQLREGSHDSKSPYAVKGRHQNWNTEKFGENLLIGGGMINYSQTPSLAKKKWVTWSAHFQCKYALITLFKNEDDLKNKDDIKNERDLKMKMTS